MAKLYLPLVLSLTACTGNSDPAEKPPVKSAAIAREGILAPDTVRFADTTWLGRFAGKLYVVPDTISSRPAAYYLRHPAVSPLAKALYAGRYRPSDVQADSVMQLLVLVSTDDEQIRPFYRWCLDFTIYIADGALGEYPGEPARQYALKFPQEFLTYLNQDSSGARYKRWGEAIAYSGLSKYPESLEATKNQLKREIQANCSCCNEATRRGMQNFFDEVVKAKKLQEEI
jgi:hypothetical protein